MGEIKTGKQNLQTKSSINSPPPQGQQQLTQTVSRNASYFPGGLALSTPANYVNNRYLAPIAQMPHNFNQVKTGIKNRNLMQAGMGALGMAGGVATMIPDPIFDVAMPAYDFYKGANRAENRDAGFKKNLTSGLQSLSMENPTGIGDVITRDTGKQTALNLVEMGSMFVAPSMISKMRARNLQAISGEIVRAKDLANANQIPNLDPTQWMKNKQYISEVFEKALPQMARSKEMRKLEVSNPAEWHRVVGRFLEDAYITSQNPGLDIGLSAKGLKRMDQPGNVPIKTRISNFVNKTLTRKDNVNEKELLFRAEPGVVGLLRKERGINTSNFDHTIDTYSVRHAINRHGKDNIPLKPEHILLAPDIIKNPDKIFVSPHKTGQGNIAVVYKKKIGNFFVYVEEVRKSSKELAFKTMYIKQSEVGSFAPEGAALLRSSEKQIPNPSETSFSIPPKVKGGAYIPPLPVVS